MTTPTPPPESGGTTATGTVRRDGWVFTGLAAVALAAIVASFSTLAHLAEAVGWDGFTSWLLPGCIDALALASGRVWLSTHVAPSARRYARAVTLAAIAVSVLGNAVGHLLTAGYLTPNGAAGVVLVILVGSVPPAALGAVGHLAALAGTPLAPQTTTATATQPGTETETPTAPAAGTATGNTDTNGTGTARRSRPARTRTTGTGTKTATKAGSRAGARDAARAYWDTERAAGRTPSGAELARVGDVDPSLGRRWRRDFETTDTTTADDDGAAAVDNAEADAAGVVALTDGRAA